MHGCMRKCMKFNDWKSLLNNQTCTSIRQMQHNDLTWQLSVLVEIISLIPSIPLCYDDYFD